MSPDLTPPLPILYIYIFVDVHVHVLDQFCSVSRLIHMCYYFCFAMDMWIVYCTFVGQKMLTRSRTVGDLIAKERVRHAEMRVWSLRLKA